MERTVWTDERIDDRFHGLENEMRAMRADIAELRREMHNQFLVLVSAILTLAGTMVVMATSL
jgi:hypothetical protein